MADFAELGIKVDSRQVTTADNRLDRLTATGGRAEAMTGRLRGSARGLAVSLGAAGVAGAAFLMGKAFTKSISLGKDFTTQLSDLSAITGIVDEQLDDIGERALEASQKTGRSATEIVEAYKLVASQLAEQIDFETAAGQRVLRQVAEDAVTLSQAARIDLSQAVQATTTAINQFNLEAEASSSVINNLAAGSKFGAAEVGNIQAAMQEAGSAAASAGEDITTTNAAIQVLAANAITGSRAGTGLRQVFLRLQTEADKLARNGIKDVNIQSDGLTATLRKLTPLLGDAGALTDIFGQEAFNAASLLISNVDALESLEGKLTDTNTATEQAGVQMDNLEGDIARLTQTINADLIESFNNSENTFRESVQEIQRLWEEFGDDFVSVLDFIVSQTSASMKRWREVLTGEVDTTLNLVEDDLLTTLQKLDAKLTTFVISQGKTILGFAGTVLQGAYKELIQDPLDQIAGGDSGRGPIGQGVLAIDEDAVTTPLDNVLDRINMLGRGYGVLKTKAMGAGDGMEQSGNDADSAREKFIQFNDVINDLNENQLTFTDEQLLGDIQRQFRQFERLGEIFDDYDVGRAKARLLRSEIEDLVTTEGTHGATVSRLIQLYEKLGVQGLDAAKDIGEQTDENTEKTKELSQAARDLGFTFSSAAEEAIVQWQNLGNVLQGVLQDILRIIVRTQITQPLGESFSGFLDGLNLFGGGESVDDALITKEGKVIRFNPNDNIMGFQGDKIPGGGSNVTVNINNQTGAQVDVTRRQTPRGVQIDALIRNTVKDGMERGAFDGTMNRNFGITRRGRT